MSSGCSWHSAEQPKLINYVVQNEYLRSVGRSWHSVEQSELINTNLKKNKYLAAPGSLGSRHKLIEK